MALENIQNYIVGLLLFVVIITGGVVSMGEFSSRNVALSNAPVTDFEASFNKSAEITDTVGEISSSIDSVSTREAGALGWLSALLGSAFNGLKAVGQSLGFVDSLGEDTVSFLGVPAIYPMMALIILIVTVVIGFAIWSAIMRV